MSEETIKQRQARFSANLGDTDPLQIVVRGHLHVEAELIDLITESVAMARPNAIDLADLSFRKKVELGIALGLIAPRDKKSFLELHALRNKIAHDLELKISAANAENLYASLSEFFKHLYGKKPASFKRYRVVLRQCIAVMWVHLNELRADQHQFKEKMKENHQRVEKLLRARGIER